MTPNGGHAWWTSSADDLNTTLTRALDLSSVRSATVSAKAWYDIEAGYDYLYGEYSTDGGANWTTVGTLSDTSNGKWTTLKYTVPGGNENTLFRFRYQTDGGVHLAGAFIDDIVVKNGGTTLFTDDVEAVDDNGWTAEGGFKISTGSETSSGDRYYLIENRTYVGYDETLRDGPYQFDKAYTAPDHVERFPFQDGMLVWAVDETYTDNNTIDHQGHGLVLPIDARPVKFTYPDGTGPSNRRQPFDATFGLQPFDAVSLHKEILVGKGKSQTVQSVAAVGTTAGEARQATFSDVDPDAYFSSTNPLGGVYVAGHGVTATVTSQVSGGAMTVDVDEPRRVASTRSAYGGPVSSEAGPPSRPASVTRRRRWRRRPWRGASDRTSRGAVSASARPAMIERMGQWAGYGQGAAEGIGWARFFGWASFGFGVTSVIVSFVVPLEGQYDRTVWLVLFGSVAVWLGGMSVSRYRSRGRRWPAVPVIGIGLGCLTIAIMIYAFTVLVLASYGIDWPAPAQWLGPTVEPTPSPGEVSA